jgi:hypothetical protein
MAKAINKEMLRVKVAWKMLNVNTPQEVRDGKVPDLTGFQEIGCHIVFNIKMDFTRKAHFVAGGHMTEAPRSLMYSSVVSHDSICIAFLIAALNGLDIMSCDLENAYLNDPCHEKIWFEGGLECGDVIARKQALQSGWSSSLSLLVRLERNVKTGQAFFVFYSGESGRMGLSG